MAIAVKIDFDNLYKVETISEDLKISTFQTELADGSFVPLKVEISNEAHELLPNVYNLAFGPMNQKGQIDDKAQLTHKDYSKVFSTILLNGLTYLDNNKKNYLGIDGSDNARAYLYYMFLQRNYNYLDKFFNIYGLKYYVRITRFGKTQYDNPFDFEDVRPYPDRIQKGTKLPPELMYNYFIFNSK
ncbi:MAG: hypothetical protein ABUL46_00110 [Chitinophaga rupis]